MKRRRIYRNAYVTDPDENMIEISAASREFEESRPRSVNHPGAIQHSSGVTAENNNATVVKIKIKYI